MNPVTASRVLGKRLDIAHLLANDPPPLDEVLPGLVTGTVGMLAGPGGVGKTMFELQVAVTLAAGLARQDSLLSAWGGEKLPESPCRVVLVAAEEPVEVIWLRIRDILRRIDQSNELFDSTSLDDVEALLAENLHIYALAGDVRLQLIDESLRPTGHMDALTQVCEGARLVLLDPLRQLHLEDENCSRAMSAMVSQLKRLARVTRSAVVFAHHTNRAATQFGMDSADAARGSTALTADARWQVNLGGVGRDDATALGLSSGEAIRHLLLHSAKGNYMERRAPLLLRREAGGVLRAVESRAPSTKRARSK